ncbi:MAG: ABC transporter ATP-binding protein [Verrucomicrobiae bacterium]
MSIINQQINSQLIPLHILLWRLWGHLSRRRRCQFWLVLLLMLSSAICETASLGAVVPFLGVLVAPDKLFNYPIATRTADIFGISSPSDFVLFFSAAFAVAALVAGSVRMLLLWSSTRLTYACASDIGFDVYRRTLYQPLQVHMARNSSEVTSGIDYKVGYAINVLFKTLSLLSSLMLLFAIMSALLAIDAAVASIAAVSFGIFYILISFMFRNMLETNSMRIAKETTQVVKVVQEGLGGIRDVLLDGTQPFYCGIYRRADLSLRLAMGSNVFIGGSPRFVMEAVGMVLMILLAVSLSRGEGGIGSSLPVLGALALGAQRLLPALQQIYASWVGIVESQAPLAETLAFLEQPLPEHAEQHAPAPLCFKRAICFESVRYRYAEDAPWVLDNFNLQILNGQRVGVVGGTGSGKSTMLDLLMGLIEPAEGKILVDGISIGGEARRAWQRAIAHVPQNIYLADTTLAENIAFGIRYEEIDMQRVRDAARQAQISDFIESRPGGYGAFVGERGIRLSGGQRQRIGIARALYKQATMLVFDEATSALDNITEQDVMSSIQCLDIDLTIVIVAHRLTTIKCCDTIVELLNGRVVAQGTYDQLLESSPSFRQMVMASE